MKVLEQNYDVIIVGAGPAGLSAGISVARQNMSCLIISKDLGGQMNFISKLENFPGSIISSGPILAKTLENQYLGFKGEITFDVVEKIDEIEKGLKVKTARTKYKAKAVIVAAGRIPNSLGLENESLFLNRGLHYCAKCDAPYYQRRTVASVGVGIYIIESGILLSRMVSKAYLIFQGSRLAGDKDMIKELEKRENVELIPNSKVKSIGGEGILQEITVINSSGNEKTLRIDGLFIELGSKINLDFVKHLIKLNPKKEIEINKKGETSHPSIFAVGDVTNNPYKHVSTACGDGISIGISAFNYIERMNGRFGIKHDWKKQIGDTVFHT